MARSLAVIGADGHGDFLPLSRLLGLGIGAGQLREPLRHVVADETKQVFGW